MKQLNLNTGFREDAISDFENQIATYSDILQEYPDNISYIEYIYPKKGMPQYGCL